MHLETFWPDVRMRGYGTQNADLCFMSIIRKNVQNECELDEGFIGGQVLFIVKRFIRVSRCQGYLHLIRLYCIV